MSASSQPEFLFRCNIRTESNGKFVDLKGGGGQEPPVIAFNNDTWESNANQIWALWSVPGKSTLLIQSESNKKYLTALGHDKQIQCSTSQWNDAEAQWYLEGSTPAGVNDQTVVRFRNAQHSDCYLDQKSDRDTEAQGAPFLAYKKNGGSNQAFKLWRR